MQCDSNNSKYVGRMITSVHVFSSPSEDNYYRTNTRMLLVEMKTILGRSITGKQ